jgi:drug/metabolite transporter (DMT)-like permease
LIPAGVAARLRVARSAHRLPATVRRHFAGSIFMAQSMVQRHRAIFLLLITMVIWGSTFAVTKEIGERLPPFTLAFLRVAIGFLSLLPLAWMRRRKRVAASEAPVRWPWGAVVAMALTGVALYYGLFNGALMYISSSQGALVQSCIPAVTALVAMLWLGERAGVLRWCGIALSGLGVVVVLLGAPAVVPAESFPSSDEQGTVLLAEGTGAAGFAAGAGPPMLGNLLMFATVVCWGLYTSLVKRVSHLDSVVVTTGLFGVGGLMLLPFAILETTAPGFSGSGLSGSGLSGLDWLDWLGVLYLGAIASGLAFVFYNTALARMDASQAGVYTNLIPIVGVATGVVVLQEPLSLRAVAGGVLVLLGIALTTLGGRHGGGRPLQRSWIARKP